MDIENSDYSLEKLLQQVSDNRARKQDFTAPTGELQIETKVNEEGQNTPQVILEGKGGEPTRVLRANDTALQQIASKSDIDIRTVRRLRDDYPRAPSATVP